MFEEHHNDMDNITILDALLMEENYVIDSLYDAYMICQLHEVYIYKKHVISGKQKHLECKKVVWPRKTASMTKRTDMG